MTRRPTHAEPADMDDWALYLDVCDWQATLPEDNPVKYGVACTHCEHCGAPLVFNYEGSRQWDHCYADGIRYTCDRTARGDLDWCHCTGWADSVYAYRLATLAARA